jgi:hypothetical protein
MYSMFQMNGYGTTELNALPLEYQCHYGTASGDLDVSHLINNPVASGKCRVFGLSFEEKLIHVLLTNPGALYDHYPKRFVNSAKIEVHEVQRDHVAVVLHLLN